MKIRNLVFILIGIMLVGFGVGFYSLIYNDNFSFSNFRDFPIKNINVNSEDSIVRIGIDGIEVHDRDSHIIVGWNGVKVIDGDDKVIVAPGKIGIEDGSNNNLNFGWNWFESSKLSVTTLDEEKLQSISGIEDISVYSPFVDIELILEDREDVRIKYSGRLIANLVPELEVDQNGSKLDIKLKVDGSSYTITDSTAKLKVFIPLSYEGNYNIASTSGDISTRKLRGWDIKISSSSGDMELGEFEADKVNLSSSSGDIRAESIHGNIDINTSSGDVSFKTDGLSGNINIITSSGDVKIENGPGSSYYGSVNTSSGDFQYSSNIKVTNSNKDNYQFIIGSGENTMKINTSSGDIEFR